MPTGSQKPSFAVGEPPRQQWVPAGQHWPPHGRWQTGGDGAVEATTDADTEGAADADADADTDVDEEGVDGGGDAGGLALADAGEGAPASSDETLLQPARLMTTARNTTVRCTGLRRERRRGIHRRWPSR